jgi:hypothetical protein
LTRRADIQHGHSQKMKRSRNTKIDFLEKENTTIHPRCHCDMKYSIFKFGHPLYLIERRAINKYNKLSLRLEHSILPFFHAILILHHLYIIQRHTRNITTYVCYSVALLWLSFLLSKFVFVALPRHHSFLKRHMKTIITSSS